MPESKEVQPPAIKNEFRAREGRRWLIIIMYLLLALIIAIAVVFLGRWIYRSATHEPTKTTQTGQLKNGSLKQHPAAGSSQSNSQPGQSSGQSNQKQSATSGSVPNTGPGNLVAVFAVAATAAGGTHYVIRRRQGV